MRSLDCTYPHTTHCLATGEIMISTMGDREENGKGDFVLVDSKTLKLTGEYRKQRWRRLVRGTQWFLIPDDIGHFQMLIGNLGDIVNTDKCFEVRGNSSFHREVT